MPVLNLTCPVWRALYLRHQRPDFFGKMDDADATHYRSFYCLQDFLQNFIMLPNQTKLVRQQSL